MKYLIIAATVAFSAHAIYSIVRVVFTVIAAKKAMKNNAHAIQYNPD